MGFKADAETLYQSYMKLGAKKQAKSGKFGTPDDMAVVERISSRISLITMQLNSRESYSAVDIHNIIIVAKQMFIQYSCLKARRDNLIKDSLVIKMDELVKAICDTEAEMLSEYRLQQIEGRRIDINAVFEKKQNRNRLSSTTARDIVAEALNTKVNRKNQSVSYYITKTGKKYHTYNCPFCMGTALSAVSKEMVENLRLEPCGCLYNDPVFATVFIDESIRPIRWNSEGHRGEVGSFSYIICRGLIKDENSITDDKIISKDVELVRENVRLDKVTIAAVGRVLLCLLYDHDFTGYVQIYTDNMQVAERWSNDGLNSKLAKQFKSVNVDFIPREKNTKADTLGRSRRILNIPVDTYIELINQRNRIKELEKIIEENGISNIES